MDSIVLINWICLFVNEGVISKFIFISPATSRTETCCFYDVDVGVDIVESVLMRGHNICFRQEIRKNHIRIIFRTHADDSLIIHAKEGNKTGPLTDLSHIFLHTLKCLSIGTPKTINFLFVSNGKLMVFKCPNIQAHCNEAVIYLNFGTPKNNEFSIWNKWKINYF